jgi:hypothetical protein
VYVVKDLIWPEIGYDPHAGQRDFHNTIVRHRTIAGGRRGGKSRAGGNELVPEAILTKSLATTLDRDNKQRIFWIGGPDYTDVEKEWRVLWNSLKRLGMPFDRPGTYNDPLGGNMHISLWEGRFQVHGKSAKYWESWDGEGLSGMLLVEAAKLKERMWDQYVRPSLADERGWSIATSTPEGKNWFYKRWQRGNDPSKTAWRSWRFPAWINPYVYPGGATDQEILDMKDEMSEERFAQEIEASFTDFVGRVFKDFDEEIHVTDVPYRPDLPLFGAVDYGWTNPFVWLGVQMDVWQNVYVVGEYRVSRRDINDISRDLQRVPWASNASVFYPDPAGPTETSVLERALRVRAGGSTGGPLKDRLEKIRQWLKLVPESHPIEKRKPKLFIDRSCIGLPLGDGGLIREMLDYRYPETRKETNKAQPEEPLDKDNHGPEALGRFFAGHFGEAEDARGGRAVVRRAVIRSASS